MFLDLSQGDQAVAAKPQPGEQARLPATFGEGFEASWRENQLFGQSLSGETARQQALSDHIDDVRQRTGVDLAKDIDYSGAAFGGALTADMLRETVNATAKKAGQPELSADDLEQAAVAKSRAARSDYALMAAREKAPGGGAGFLLGGLAGAATDPVNVLALPVAPAEGLPLLAYALRWGAIAAASQAAIETTAAPFHEAVQPGYLASGEPLANVATAGAGGAVLGAGTKVAVTALARAWGRVKTGEWPTSVRDAGNLAESEANVQATNIYPGAEGEAAHRDALATAVDQVVKGAPVDVAAHVTPEVAAAGEQRLSPIMDARASAIGAGEAAKVERAAATGTPTPELPFEATAKEGASEAAVAQVADHVQQIARGEAPGFDVYHGSPHDFEQFDLGKIGKGQGAQSYGHGLYFAEKRGVAETYSKMMPASASGAETLARETLRDFGGDNEAAARELRRLASSDERADRKKLRVDAAEIVEKGDSLPASNLYKVRINADREHFLDWDKPLSQQSQHVKDALAKVPREVFEDMQDVAENHGMNAPEDHLDADYNGSHLWRFLRRLSEEGPYFDVPELTHPGAEEEVSQFLKSLGVTGIKYLDQDSRRAGEGTRNFVLFDDKLASIAEKNGMPTMPREDAEKLAKMIAKADEPHAQAIIQAIQERPSTVADFPPRAESKAVQPETEGTVTPEIAIKMLASPEHEQAIRADIDRARQMGDVKIPAGIDEKGEPVFRSVDGAMDEIDGYRAAADQIKACANPQPETPENG